MPLPTDTVGEIRFAVARLEASAAGARSRAADGNDVAESIARADAFDHAVRVMRRLVDLANHAEATDTPLP